MVGQLEASAAVITEMSVRQPPDRWTRLAAIVHPFADEAVVTATEVPAREFEISREDRRLKARNLASDPIEYVALARDVDVEVRRLVAGNPLSPPQAVARQQEDADEEVQQLLAARNPADTTHWLSHMCRHEDRLVRAGAAQHPLMPDDLLDSMKSDTDTTVCSRVSQALLYRFDLKRLLQEREVQAVREVESRSLAEPPAPTLIRTPSDAELAAARWLRWMGFEDADITPDGPDGGIDVLGAGIIAQVKAEMVKTGRPIVQQTFGIARAAQCDGAVFSLSGFTTEAVQWAEEHGVALFEFDFQGEPQSVTVLADRWITGELWR